MYCITPVVVACLILSTASALAPKHVPTSNEYQQFEAFMTKYNKKYDSTVEFARRFEIFKSNLKRIAEQNSDPNDYAVHGVTKFSDMTPKEFSESLGYRKTVRNYGNDVQPAVVPAIVQDVPESFDWRDHGAVTRVKNQGLCGSCWAFSVVGNIEGQNAIKNNELVEFSEQQIVSCDKTSLGCGGGNSYLAMRYVIKAGGLETEEDYPYKGLRGRTCNFDASKINVSMTSIHHLQRLDEDNMKVYLYTTGPLSACLNANPLQSYESGVLNPTDCDPKSIDHCVVIVGYGTQDIPYWIIKNSWDTNWGEAGYFRLARGSNTCGISQEVNNAILV